MQSSFDVSNRRQPATVACIIPFYNGSGFIRRSIESILSQTLPPNEIIVVNDGSNEQESRLLEEISRDYPNLRVLTKKNGGQGDARNFGAQHTECDFLCFLDQDDFYLPRHVEDLVEAIDLSDPLFGFAYADLYEADGSGRIIRNSMVKEHSIHPKQHINDMLRNDMFILPSASIIRKSAFVRIDGFDPRLTGYEDDDLFLRLFRSGFSHRFLDKPVTVWCIHMESTSYSIRMSRSRLIYFEKLCAEYKDIPQQNRFYFRDCILPRFSKLFMNDALGAIRSNSKDTQELIEIFEKFKAITQTNEYVPDLFKLKLKALSLATRLPKIISRPLTNLTKYQRLRMLFRAP